MISKIPVKKSVFDNPINQELPIEAYELAFDAMRRFGASAVDKPIVQFVFAGYYHSQVMNGGHSQLTSNMERVRSEIGFNLHDVRFGFLQIGAKGVADIVEDFCDWLSIHPLAAGGQTGFEGGRAEFLDILDDRYSDQDVAYVEEFRSMLPQANTEIESCFIADNLKLKGDFFGHVGALEMMWLLRSGVLEVVEDAYFEDVRQRLLTQTH